MTYNDFTAYLDFLQQSLGKRAYLTIVLDVLSGAVVFVVDGLLHERGFTTIVELGR